MFHHTIPNIKWLGVKIVKDTLDLNVCSQF